MWRMTWLVLSLTLAAACSDDPTRPDPGEVFEFGFATGVSGWTADVADHEPHHAAQLDFEAAHREAAGEAPAGFRLASNNPSDDVFMFIKRRLSGLEPGRSYDLEFDVRFGTNSPSNCAGAGGAPGESVYVKAGATAIEPVPVTVDDFVTMNIDHGAQSEEGEDTLVLGDVGNGTNCEVAWVMKELSSTLPLRVTADDTGALWLLIGTDSGHESRTEIVYTMVRVVAREA